MNTNKILRIQGDYWFTAGLSLIVVGATQIFNNPYGILFSGITIFFVGAILKVMEK